MSEINSPKMSIVENGIGSSGDQQNIQAAYWMENFFWGGHNLFALSLKEKGNWAISLALVLIESNHKLGEALEDIMVDKGMY